MSCAAVDGGGQDGTKVRRRVEGSETTGRGEVFVAVLFACGVKGVEREGCRDAVSVRVVVATASSGAFEEGIPWAVVRRSGWICCCVARVAFRDGRGCCSSGVLDRRGRDSDNGAAGPDIRGRLDNAVRRYFSDRRHAERTVFP